uniref:Ig-like domain-containing protein n=1 Tax=Gouania willdenowi TaxID=441366 RepID=A0A8C5HU79_GOUWI
TGLLILWYRNCSHQNQPTLVLDNYDQTRGSFYTNIPPRFKMMRNDSSNSYDLEISNVTASDEGLYYCGTKEAKVEEKHYISRNVVYKYGNVTTNVTVGKYNVIFHHS